MTYNKPIAIVGVSGVFPGASTLKQFWNNIENKVDSIIDVPRHRWILNSDKIMAKGYKPDRICSKKAGLIENFNFDSNGFNIDGALLKLLDPLYHLILHAGKDGLQNCMTTPEIKQRTGVVLAAIALPTDSSSFITRQIMEDVLERKFVNNLKITNKHIINNIGSLPLSKMQCAASYVTAFPAAVLANTLGLGGGSCTLDAACASSLFAIKIACDELNFKRCDMMITGGVSRPDSLYTQIGFTQLQALSPTGRCAPFDKSANGLVVGEGAGILVLKRVDDAIHCGDNILGLICSTGVSNDVTGNLLAPDTKGQLRAMNMAYKNAKWSPSYIDYIECHGAGTPVGDTVELSSMVTLWNKNDISKLDKKCSIGSIKSMTGHLLTGAGVAGIIKTVLAMNNKVLPPSLNFTQPSDKSPLIDSPFKVQTISEQWLKKDKDIPRRAAVSSFGFGGINAHTLIEQWDKNQNAGLSSFISKSKKIIKNYKTNLDSKTYPKDNTIQKTALKSDLIAIVGMETICGGIKSLNEFKEAIFLGHNFISKRPEKRWKGFEDTAYKQLNGKNIYGNYQTDFQVGIGEFHIPPNELPDILPQHLLMLKTAAGALKDANLVHESKRQTLLNMGCAIGISFDFQETDFHARWNIENFFNKLDKKYNISTGDKYEDNKLIDSLKNICSPQLTATRTIGSLGSIIASRIAREFKLGGAAFVISGEETSGIKALEVGIISLQKYETDCFLVGAVDFPGDLRRVILSDKICNLATDGKIAPFDISSEGTLPGEGSVAVVLKRVEQAVNDGDKIYAVIKGTGSASSGDYEGIKTISNPSNAIDFTIKKTYKTSLNRCFKNSNTDFSNIGYIETHGSSDPIEDKIESDAILESFAEYKNRNNDIRQISSNDFGALKKCSIGSVKANIGHTKAAAGLFSIVKTSLCLYHKIIPPLINFSMSANTKWNNSHFHIPISDRPISDRPISDRPISDRPINNGPINNRPISDRPINNRPISDRNVDNKHWTKSDGQKKRMAVIATITTDGNCAHAILEEFQYLKYKTAKENVSEKNQPVFNIVVGGDNIIFPPFKTSEIANNENLCTIKSYKESHVKTSSLSNDYKNFNDNMQKITDAHKTYLSLSNEITSSFAQSFNFQSELIQQTFENKEPITIYNQCDKTPPVFSRAMCMEFAVGSVGKVLGKQFDIIDSYDVRVRLPDEPLMLVDRIISVKGTKCSMKAGKIITEHDVYKDAWYLDGQKMPVSLTIEAGQADLFLCSYLGIDHIVKGKRSYRLLDAFVTFHRGLPQPGDIIRYEIEIEKFIRQGKTWLFFFHYKGYIDGKLLISMQKGCAGFFTKEEVKNSGGIILTDTKKCKGKIGKTFKSLVLFKQESYDEKSVNALRTGNLEKAFGQFFKGKKLAKSLWLPDGRLNLIDRVISIEPDKGQYGIGMITAQADINHDDWFLTCHFVDDMVMPGTLMYECCAHTLRIFTLRMGWATDNENACYEPIIGLESDLKCRGPVTSETNNVTYKVEIKEIGYNPEPYILADAYMYSDDLMIVYFKNMGLKISNITKNDIDIFWKT